MDDQKWLDRWNGVSEEIWEWQDDIPLPSNSWFDISNCGFDELNQNGKDPWDVFDDETTPIKDYVAFDSSVSTVDSEVVMDKNMEDFHGISSQSKRRRMLQFRSSEGDACISDGKISGSVRWKNVKEVSTANNNGNLCLSNINHEEQLLASIIPEERRSPRSEHVSSSSHEWMVDYFNEPELQRNSSNLNLSYACEEQFDVSGATSFAKIPANASTSDAYPFTVVKPYGIHGGATLNDINQRILDPLSSKSKQKKNKDAGSSYPTSTFSGKSIVSLTKIHTVGGNGSITIMRTKG